MNKEYRDPNTVDLKAPRLARYLQTAWKKHQNIVYCVDIKLAQQKGFKFYQTRSNAIILYDTLPGHCIPKAIMMETGEIIYEKEYMRHFDLLRRFFKTIGCRNWVQKLLEMVKTPNKPNQKPKIQLFLQEDLFWQSNRPVRVLRKSTIVSYVAARVPMCLFERSDRDKDADENVDADQTSTERPVESGQSIGLFTQREEIDIDFRVSGLPHAVVKQAENFGVRELVKKMESHLHRQALQADLQQSNAYNPFGEKSKKMIRDMGNVELFESCETIPKVQCSECLL